MIQSRDSREPTPLLLSSNEEIQFVRTNKLIELDALSSRRASSYNEKLISETHLPRRRLRSFAVIPFFFVKSVNFVYSSNRFVVVSLSDRLL